MKFISDSVFIKRYFDASCRPTKALVKSWVVGHIIDGKIIGGLVYIDEDKWLEMAHYDILESCK